MCGLEKLSQSAWQKRIQESKGDDGALGASFLGCLVPLPTFAFHTLPPGSARKNDLENQPRVTLPRFRGYLSVDSRVKRLMKEAHEGILV